MYLVFDCETTGFPSNDLPKEDPKQARIVSLAAALVSQECKIVLTFSCILQATKYSIKIPPQAISIHGIDPEYADKFGISREVAGIVVTDLLKSCSAFVAFNVNFDWRMLKIEWPLEEKHTICLMHSTREAVSAKCGEDKKRYSLAFTYETLFGKKLENNHEAGSDLYAAISLLKYLSINNPSALAIAHGA